VPSPSSPLTRAIFEQAADLTESARVDFLREACAGDEPLRRRVLRLLAAHDKLGAFLDVAPVWNAGEADPRSVGKYEIVRKLGEGGMGRVYLAEPGPVAVKVIRRDLDPAAVLRRFDRERQILARLDHPNIARLLDGGKTTDGSPYLVMAYVDGTQLDDFCLGRELAPRERLELFLGVCRAVAFAHGRLVIHRDLKPANILVTDSSVPVVMDFGLAKLAATNLETALDSTTTGHRLLTPDYASPEQVTGLAVTPAVDVYALGVVLYELLTDVRPHRFATWSMAEVVDVICRGVVPPPSSVADSVKQFDPVGALDFIVMKALAKAPGDRYSHVTELDDDLQRYLQGRSIPGFLARTYQTNPQGPAQER
jgi:serine/threonine protein kinase